MGLNQNNQNKTLLLLTDFINFSGVITEKLPNTEFIVRLTHFPDGTKTPEDQEVFVTAKLTGKIRDKKIKIAVHDSVTVSINMEGAPRQQGFIIYRDRGKSPIIQINPQKKPKFSGSSRGVLLGLHQVLLE